MVITEASIIFEENEKKFMEKNIRLVSTDLKAKSIADPMIADFKVENDILTDYPIRRNPLRSKK